INAGLLDLVKASITGAILGNILLIFGLSIIAGGFKYKEQFFNRQNTGVQSSMLFLAVIGLAVPTVLAATTLKPVYVSSQIKLQILSDSLAFLLLAVYIAGIIFTVFTHKHLFFAQPPVEVQTEMEGQKRLSLGRKETEKEGEVEEEEWNHKRWGKKKSFVLLGISMAGVIIVSEILVGSVEATTKEFGFGELFVGVVIIGIVGNAAEHTSAIILARKGKIDLSIGIAAGSGTQIALFVVPILVIAGIIIGKPVTLVFTIFELVSIFLAAIILNLIAHDGKSNWFEGLMLTTVYVIIAIGFYFIS
ncbi:MAG: calcium/proton exchanger, partial [Nitrososphaeraceae archaeon]